MRHMLAGGERRGHAWAFSLMMEDGFGDAWPGGFWGALDASGMLAADACYSTEFRLLFISSPAVDAMLYK